MSHSIIKPFNIQFDKTNTKTLDSNIVDSIFNRFALSKPLNFEPPISIKFQVPLTDKQDDFDIPASISKSSYDIIEYINFSSMPKQLASVVKAYKNLAMNPFCEKDNNFHKFYKKALKDAIVQLNNDVQDIFKDDI